ARAATEPQQRLRDRPNGVAPLDDGSTRPFGGGNVAGDHVSSPAVSFAVAIALLPAMREADGRAVAVVVAAAVGVRLPASPVSARRHVPGMRPLAADKSLARRAESRAWALCTQSRPLPWSCSQKVRRSVVDRNDPESAHPAPCAGGAIGNPGDARS